MNKQWSSVVTESSPQRDTNATADYMLDLYHLKANQAGGELSALHSWGSGPIMLLLTLPEEVDPRTIVPREWLGVESPPFVPATPTVVEHE